MGGWGGGGAGVRASSFLKATQVRVFSPFRSSQCRIASFSCRPLPCSSCLLLLLAPSEAIPNHLPSPLTLALRILTGLSSPKPKVRGEAQRPSERCPLTLSPDLASSNSDREGLRSVLDDEPCGHEKPGEVLSPWTRFAIRPPPNYNATPPRK